uniref:Uncharacterized protein AlNc14C1G202 n=1 Tax=Albugo laibachii Nc14 TaxID=890382 RepID=F0VZ61_9STRA|nr:conserved hypothetical protein [Albugo laibachii Nc14]|eukprot:CCA14076.1 conserved hypothetical protein [Albugo laibachii Nc14]
MSYHKAATPVETSDRASVCSNESIRRHSNDWEEPNMTDSKCGRTDWYQINAKHLVIIIGIALGGYAGVAIRVLLTCVSNWILDDSRFLTAFGSSYFMANVLGTLLMGAAVRGRYFLASRSLVYYTSFTTGFCGCLTTFSSWNFHVAAAFVHGRWCDAILNLFLQFSTVIFAFRIGIHMTEALQQYAFPECWRPHVDIARLGSTFESNLKKLQQRGETACTNPFTSLKSTLESGQLLCKQILGEGDSKRHRFDVRLWLITGFVVTAVLWILPFLGWSVHTRSRFLAICVAPLGAWIRYYLSGYNKRPKWSSFPLLTLIPNVTASYLCCIVSIIKSVSVDPTGSDSQLYTILGDGVFVVGFLGSLSTVSTWISEIDALSQKSTMTAYRYAVVTTASAQCGSVIILGLWVAFGSHPLVS